MPDNNLLIAEDDEELSILISRRLRKEGYSVTTAKDGKEALELLRKDRFPVVLSDLLMPNMNGKELISELHRIGIYPVFIMFTADDSAEQIIDIMRLGVFDYVIKPVSMDVLSLKVSKAFNQAELIRMKQMQSLEREIRIEKQIEFSHWKELMLDRNHQKDDQNFLSRLQRSLNQGGGIGSLMSLVSFIPHVAKKDGDKLILPEDFSELLLKSAELASQALNIFTELDALSIDTMTMKPTRVETVLEIIQKAIDDSQEFAGLKEQTIIQSDLSGNYREHLVNLNEEKLRRVIDELLLNAYKFSEPRTTIMILYKIYLHNLVVSILSVPMVSENIKGVPADYEKIVFEPFFRINKTVDERYKSLDYGLGLTIAQKIIQKHEGRILMFNVKDFLGTSKTVQTRVSVEVQIPLTNAD